MPHESDWRQRKAPVHARPGDCLILGKALGLGLYRAAHAAGELSSHDHTLLLNDRPQEDESARLLACLSGVHAMVALGGQGFLGTLWSVCQAAGLRASLQLDHMPVLPSALALAEGGVAAAEWRWAKQDAGHCWLAPAGEPLGRGWQGTLSIPENSGSLLVSCAPETVTEVLSLFLQQDFNHAAVIGQLKKPGRHGQNIVFH